MTPRAGTPGVAGSGRGPRLLAAGLALVPILPAAGAQEPAREPPPGAEGPLDNDVFLPTEAAAEQLLARGDAALREARAGAERDDPDAARRLVEALEAWHEALAVAGPGASVWAEPPERDDRRLTEGLTAGVLRRLAELTAAERGTWEERFGASAAAELEAGTGTPEELAELERLHPGTAAAVRAALILLDRALESGRDELARGWAARAAEHLARAQAAPAELAAALARRRARLASGLAPASGTGEAWASARSLAPAGALRLPDPEARLAAHNMPPPRAGARPGLVFLSDERFLVQTTSVVHVVRAHPDGTLQGELSFDPRSLLPGIPVRLDVRLLGRRTPGWALLPTTASDGDVLLVVGRSFRPSGESNALVCLRAPDAAGAPTREPLERRSLLPQLRWGIVGDLRIDADGEVERIPELAELDGLELQPGPLVVGSLVLVQAREYAGDVRSWLLAFDRVAGELRWKRLIATGSDLLRDLGRLAAGDPGLRPRLAAQPLALADGRVLAGTHLGAAALVDVVDGRPLWSVRNRRRAADAPGWDGGRPLRAEDGSGALLWAPHDSDRLYALRAGPLPAGAPPRDGVFVAPPRPVGEALFLAGGGVDATVVLARAGSERTVSTLLGPGRGRRDGLYLGPDEDFQGRALVSPDRALACTDRGIYLFDRTRELYLLDYAALGPAGSVTLGGDLYARGSLVVALSRDGVWAFRTR